MSNISSIIKFFNLEDKKKIIFNYFFISNWHCFESLSVGLILLIFSILIAGKQSLLSSDIFLKFSPDFLITMLQNNMNKQFYFKFDNITLVTFLRIYI